MTGSFSSKIARIKSLRILRVFKSLRLRIFAIVFLMALLSSVCVKYAVLSNYETRAVSVRQSDVQTQLRILANHLITYNFMQNPSSDVVTSEISLLSNLYDGRVLVINSDLEIIADSYNLSLGKIIIYDDVTGCLKRGSEGGTAYYDADNGYIEFTTPIVETLSLREGEGLNVASSQVVRGVLLTSVSTASIATTLDILSGKADRIMLIVIIAVFFFSFFLSKLLLTPFERITKAINEVKAGYTSEPISVPDYIETEHITNAFNQLLGRMKTIDDTRQEFVSNVSHELKTPITSMKVLADTLLSDENASTDTYREFMKDISDEINREDSIINDLLLLVKMDSSKTLTNVKLMNINEMTEIVLKRLRPIARQKDIELTLESEREITAEVDEVKFSLVIMNLVENAIKYNHDGGFVRVFLDADHQYFTLKVEDSGIGIPEESFNKLYERFYRVDKSRYREGNGLSETGGTGLGLAVAKEAVLAHRGEIDVKSTEGEGSVFTVRIPLRIAETSKPAESNVNVTTGKKSGRLMDFLKSLCVILGVSCLLSGCAGAAVRTDSSDASFRLYYVNSEKTGLTYENYVPETDMTDTDDMLEEIINTLGVNPTGIVTSAPISGDVVLRGYEFTDGILTLNFDILYNMQDEITEILTRAAIVRTLLQIEGVESIYFLVDGTALTDDEKEPVGEMNASTFIFNAGSEMHTYDRVRLLLYFASEDGSSLIPVYRSMVYNSNVSMERLITEQLIMGPKTDGVYAAVSPDTKVNNVILQDGICYVDLSDAFLTQTGNASAAVSVYSLVNSLTELSGVESVKIFINGSDQYSFLNQIPLSGSFERDESYISAQ